MQCDVRSAILGAICWGIHGVLMIIFMKDGFEMKKVIFLTYIIVALLVTGCAISNISANVSKNEKSTLEDLSSYFTGYDGCFVLFDQNKNEYSIYNEPKSQKQVSPCSTFKIVNALIGLETKVLTDENTTFNWDGTVYQNTVWNKDQTLESAITNSTFWYFQQNASKVGTERMQNYVNKTEYGNMDITGGITRFWEQSSLKISPKEQVEMLRKIYTYQIPFSKENIDIVKGILILSKEDDAVLSGKTGSGLKDSGRFIPQGADDEYIIGWFVGYIEKDNNVYYFATNIEGEKGAYGGKAKEITLKILKDKKLL
jgi:bla regulator protein BlaR1